MAVRRFAAGLLCAFLLLPAGCGQAQETKDQQLEGEQEPVTFRVLCIDGAWSQNQISDSDINLVLEEKPASLWKLNTWRERSATVCSF